VADPAEANRCSVACQQSPECRLRRQPRLNDQVPSGRARGGAARHDRRPAPVGCRINERLGTRRVRSIGLLSSVCAGCSRSGLPSRSWPFGLWSKALIAARACRSSTAAPSARYGCSPGPARHYPSRGSVQLSAMLPPEAW